jgi:hypothetical protein
VTDALDELRVEYTDYYAESEAVARSSIIAERLSQTLRADRAIAEAMLADRAAAEAKRAARATAAAQRAATDPESRHHVPAKKRPAGTSTADRVARRIPHSVRAMVPGGLRRWVRGMLDRRQPPR